MKKIVFLLFLLFLCKPAYATTKTLTAGTGISVTGVAGVSATVAGVNATTGAGSGTKGVASFDSSNFADSSGHITIKDAGVSLTAEVTGTLPMANGGTAVTTLTTGALLVGNAATNIDTLALTTDGAIVIGDGVGKPTTLNAFTGAAGTLKHESGGLEADVSLYNGLIRITGGATSNITTKAGLDTALGSIDLALSTGDVYTGTHDFGGAVIEITNSAAPTTDTTGQIALDTTIIDHQPLLQYYDGGENMTVIAIDTAQLPALDNEIIKYDAASDKFVLEADAGTAGGAAEINVLLRPQSAKLPTSNPAAIDAGDANWRLLFDDSTDESATWEFILDDDYAGATLYADIYFSMNGANSTKNVIWDALVMAVTAADAADVGTDSYDTANSTTEGVPDTAGYLDKSTITLTNADSATAGDYIRFKLNRDANNASDNGVGDAEVLHIVIRE